MSEWRTLLQRLVNINTDEFPLLVYQVAPATGQIWPQALPSNTTITDFYALCDGGNIGQYHWYRTSDLPSVNEHWMKHLAHYYPDGSSPIVKGRHLIFAIDSGGAPLIWDSLNDTVATFWFKGGDWEPTGLNMDEFLSALFSLQPEVDTLWFEALQQLQNGNHPEF